MGTSNTAEVIKGAANLVQKMASADRTEKSVQSVRQEIFESSLQTIEKLAARKGTMLKVKSNYARDRVLSFGDLTLSFDKAGIAQIPAYRKAEIEQVMNSRPGRFSFVRDEEPEAPVVVAAPVEVPVVAASEVTEPVVVPDEVVTTKINKTKKVSKEK